MPPRFPVTRDEVGRVVARFYIAIREDRALGPIFADHVADWPAHERKIADFWANAILGERVYVGNPMRAHIAAGDVMPEHFTHWLAIFDDALESELAEDVARAWSHMAHRIGKGLSSGLAFEASRHAGVPGPRA